MLDEKRVSRLRGPERVALKQMQKIADKCNMSGTTRVEKVMMVLDDLRYNSRLTDKHGDKKRKGAFTSFVIRIFKYNGYVNRIHRRENVS